MDSVTQTSKTGTASPTLAKLAEALSKAQGEMEGARKGNVNPHFKNKYADLASIWDACREPLSKHGLSVVQPVTSSGPTVTVTTILLHASGEFLSSDLTMTPQQATPQGVGSCITYARRYALAAMVGIAPEDDDGQAASQPEKPRAVAAAPEGYQGWLDDMAAVADNGLDALKAAWSKSAAHYRKHLTEHDAAAWERLKAKAEKVKAA